MVMEVPLAPSRREETGDRHQLGPYVAVECRLPARNGARRDTWPNFASVPLPNLSQDRSRPMTDKTIRPVRQRMIEDMTVGYIEKHV